MIGGGWVFVVVGVEESLFYQVHCSNYMRLVSFGGSPDARSGQYAGKRVVCEDWRLKYDP